MDSETTISNLRKRLMIERCVFGGIALVALLAWTIGHFADSKSLILVDGKPVACVNTARDANDILAKIKTSAGCNPSEISFKQDVRVARAPGNVSPTSRHNAYRTVLRAVSPVVARWAIIVDGTPVVAVPNKATAGEVLEQAKRRYGQMARNLAEEPQFKENVIVDISPVNPAIYRKNVAEALKYLFSDPAPVSRDAVYTVMKGDVASAIAAECGTKLDSLSAMNPNINLNRLQIGDKIRVKTTSAKPKLTVVVRDMLERTESAPPPVQRVSSINLYVGKSVVISPGSAGQRKVRVETIYENGRKIRSEIVDEQVLRAPTPRRIAVGTKSR